MADKPKSTADILAAIRAKGGGEAAPAPSQPAEEAAPAESSAAPAPPKGAAKPAGDAPKGTSSILASIRSGGGAPAGGAKSDAPKPAAAAGGEAPKGTSGILASIRGGGAAQPGKAAPKADKPAAKGAAKAPAGDRPDVQGMIRAIKEGVKAPEPGAPKAPAKLPGGKPAIAKIAAQPVARRSVFAPIFALFSTPFAIAWWLMGLIGGVMTLKGAQFMMPNMVLELPSKFKVGVSSDYPPGSVSEKYKAERGIWIVHSDAYNGQDEIYALLTICTHLGCTPNWLQAEQKFKCPCHGSGFYISGVNFEGPAPRPLERVGIRVLPDGQIEVDKSIKFQEELGQWADTKSFIEMA